MNRKPVPDQYITFLRKADLNQRYRSLMLEIKGNVIILLPILLLPLHCYISGKRNFKL